MEINKINNDYFAKSADSKRLNAKNTISDCVKNGIGIYEIIDNENIFTSNARMFEYLKIYARQNKFLKQNNFIVEIKSKEKYKHIFVIIKNKEE
jgi:hypothetical protein